LNLSFIKSSISIDITSGGITVQTVPNTSFNLLAPDGTLTLPVENQENIIKIEVINGRTTVRTLVGEAKFNSTLVSAGEQFPLNSSNEASDKPVRRNDNNAKAYNPILIIGLIGGVAAIALIALSGSSNNDDPPVLSPTR
jgi:hypothetical protein